MLKLLSAHKHHNDDDYDSPVDDVVVPYNDRKATTTTSSIRPEDKYRQKLMFDYYLKTLIIPIICLSISANYIKSGILIFIFIIIFLIHLSLVLNTSILNYKELFEKHVANTRN